MARKASDVVLIPTEPKELPNGLEIVEVERKLKTLRPSDAKSDWVVSADRRVIRLIVPTPDAAGVLAYAKFYSENSGNDDDGPRFVAEAVRNTIANMAAAKVGLGLEETSVRFIAPISGLRVVDKADVIGARMMADWAEHGTPPTAERLKAIYAGIV